MVKTLNISKNIFCNILFLSLIKLFKMVENCSNDDSNFLFAKCGAGFKTFRKYWIRICTVYTEYGSATLATPPTIFCFFMNKTS